MSMHTHPCVVVTPTKVIATGWLGSNVLVCPQVMEL
ncbi:hypothetical protein Plim_3368 [Planctopirus limnophila DSM 3776]|uniref:Uncharacterized protein n=1 Tax=Planctopirus limnophila (strain ATCC 43296 / DSM 3776 / IFAM 1008 / Mu 290) TaxID=521674 RepID=D5SUC8_PLAL2|nr:hypothetical protein Plim_3368 [Planctopirus limnophila DSM 3776]